MSSSPARIPVVAKRGIFLPECGLWLDPWQRQDWAFVSHAHADHFGAHGTIIASKGTARLIEARFRGAYSLEPHMFGRTWTWRGHRLMLLPAGHTLGSAQIHVTRLSDGASLLYTGDFKIRTSRTAEPARFAPANTLIMETTFGLPKFRFPSTTKVRNALMRFCRDCLDDGEVPVLVAYSLGKAQEIMAQLAEAAFSWVLHPSCFDMTVAYEAQGVRFPPYEKLADGFDPAGKVLIVPPSAARSQAVRRIKSRRLAMCTGWALTSGAKFRYQVDEVFPLSDHADYPDLWTAVERVQPQLVLTTHGYASEFAADLRERGREAWSLGADDQLEFSFGLRGATGEDGPEVDEDTASDGSEPRAPSTREPADGEPVRSEFAAFVHTGDTMAATPGRLAKIERLADYFRSLGDDGTVAIAARFLSGRAVAAREHQKSLATGWPIVRLALLDATGISAARLRQIANAQADPGRTTCLALMHGQKAVPRHLALADIATCIDRLRTARGSIAKAAVLETYFRQMTPAEGQYLVKILTDTMHIGLKDGLIEEALAAAFNVDPASVREAHMLTGDLGETARLARRGELDRVSFTLFQPLRPMRATAEPTAQAIWDRLTEAKSGDNSASESAQHNRPYTANEANKNRPHTPHEAHESLPLPLSSTKPSVWLEDKHDGIRAQLHKQGTRVALFSRDLRSLEAEFPEVAGPAARLADDMVLDGEIVAFANGPQPASQVRPKRLGRHEPDLFLGDDDVSVRYVIFDLLYLNGESMLLRPLAERRAHLESLALPFELAPRHTAGSPAEIEAAFLAARARGHPGLIAKDPASPYSAGRRGRGWLKLDAPSDAEDPAVE